MIGFTENVLVMVNLLKIKLIYYITFDLAHRFNIQNQRRCDLQTSPVT